MKERYECLDPKIKRLLQGIRFVATDFDGVLTDGRVFHFQDGKEAVIRSRADSYGINMLNNAGIYDKKEYESTHHPIDIAIISGELNQVVASIAKKIKLKCVQSDNAKIDIFKEELKKRGLESNKAMFIGNDLNDIECIKYAGVGVAVNDAVLPVKKVAKYITTTPGGMGAFREVCELLLLARGRHPLQEILQ